MDDYLRTALLNSQEAASQAVNASSSLFLSTHSMPKDMKKNCGYKARKKAHKLIHRAIDTIYKAQDILLKEAWLPEKKAEEKLSVDQEQKKTSHHRKN